MANNISPRENDARSSFIWRSIGLYESLVLPDLQKFMTRLVSCFHQLTFEEKPPIFITAATISGWRDSYVQNIHRSIGCGFDNTFLFRHSYRFLKAPFIVLQDEICCQNSRPAFLVRVAKCICLAFSTNIGYTVIFQAATQNLTFIPSITIKHLHVAFSLRCGIFQLVMT